MEHRIFGPPGTGKTRTLSLGIRDAAAEYGAEHVLAASFTRAAARELTTALPVDEYGAPVVNEDHVATLHGLCYRALGRPELIEKKIKEWNELYPHYALTGTGIDMDEMMNDTMNKLPGDPVRAEMDLMRAQMQPTEAWRSDVVDFHGKWVAFKASHNAIDFTDMIDRVYRDRLSPHGNIAVGFFDEVQDFSTLELALVRQWGEHFEQTILAGDDDQTIYSFTGATPDAFLKPDLPASQKEVLSQSWRLPRAVHEYVVRWSQQISFREDKPFRPKQEEGLVDFNPGTWRDPYPIVEAMLQDVDDGRSVMLLGSCSYMLRPILRILRDEGQPFGNRYRRQRGDWNPLHPKGVSTSQRVLAYLRPSFAAWAEKARMWTKYDLATWAPLLKADVFLRGAKTVLVRDAKASDDARELTINELLEYLTEPALSAALDNDVDWLLQNAMPSKLRAMEFPITVLRKHGADMLRQEPSITVGTIHSVKGGEDDAVYLLPDLSYSAYQEWGWGSRDEIYRLMYVGMSRAKQHLHLCSPMGESAVNWI